MLKVVIHDKINFLSRITASAYDSVCIVLLLLPLRSLCNIYTIFLSVHVVLASSSYFLAEVIK